MQNRLRIYFRQKQLLLDNDPLSPIVVSCNPDGTPNYTPGSVPKPDWEEMTEFTEGLDVTKLSWQAVSDDFTEGDITGKNEFGSNYDKGITSDLKFFSDAFNYIFDWLMKEPCQILNAIEVRIEDKECQNEYRVFELKVDNIKWKPNDEPCIIAMTLREADETIHSFRKTIIEDNWQNWFNKDGTSTKEHPTFQMIVEKKPKFFMAIYAALIYVVGILSVGLITALTAGKKWIRRTLGFTYFCPSPLIRTYIQNICDKFGYTYDTMFDDDPANPYRDLCLFFPASVTYKSFENYYSPSKKYVWENRTVLPFSVFLNQLKKVFRAEWYVTPNKELVFKPKTFFDTQAPLYDFTAIGADKIYNLTYSFSGKKKPAYGKYEYQVDPQDTCSNEVKNRYNDIVDYDGPANNPMLEGNVTRVFDFAMTAFHNDGSSEDFLEEGVELGRLIAIGAIIVGLGQLFLASNFLTAAVVAGVLAVGYAVTNNHVNDYFNNSNLNGMVRVASSEINIPRLLLWDRATDLDKAKVVSEIDPDINTFYNIDLNDYYQEHPTHDAPGYFGTTVTKVWNYPMYLDAKFEDNLFEFHEPDNPYKNPELNQDWEGEVDLCCEWLDRLGVWQGNYAKIGSVVYLENRNGIRTIKGRIEDFKVDYAGGKITLKGKVLI